MCHEPKCRMQIHIYEEICYPPISGSIPSNDPVFSPSFVLEAFETLKVSCFTFPPNILPRCPHALLQDVQNIFKNSCFIERAALNLFLLLHILILPIVFIVIVLIVVVLVIVIIILIRNGVWKETLAANTLKNMLQTTP